MTTTYYDYDTQQWKEDEKGFLKFHNDQITFWQKELEQTPKGHENYSRVKKSIAHHRSMIRKTTK